jgi:hypothetical protein
MRWMGHIASMENIKAHKTTLKNCKGRYFLGKLGVERRIILSCILKN